MFVRGITLSLPALLALCVMAESALADHNRRPRQVIIEDQYSDAPPFIRHIPGLRIFFGDYALTEEEYDQLYGTGRRVYRDDDRDILDEEDDPPISLEDMHDVLERCRDVLTDVIDERWEPTKKRKD